jgi:hypothetical protein
MRTPVCDRFVCIVDAIYIQFVEDRKRMIWTYIEYDQYMQAFGTYHLD